MKFVILIFAAAVIGILEWKWADYAIEKLRYRGECDRILAEPGQAVTWRATVENRGRLPIPFVRLIQRFPEPVKPAGGPDWIRIHCQQSVAQWHVEEKMYLLPGQSRSWTLQFSCDRRGCHRIGSQQLSTGDLLGFREYPLQGPWHHIVVMPHRCTDPVALDAVGGFLGDISVRRFILEDPVLTVGFREYTGREPMKAISWTRTAVTGTLQVRQYDHTAEQHVVVLLNVEGGHQEELEACFSLVRTVCEQLERRKIPYGFCTNGNLTGPVGKVFSLGEGLGHRHLNTILYGLGNADSTCFWSFRLLTQNTLRNRKGNESYIVITPPLNQESRKCVSTLRETVSGKICVLEGKGEGQNP